MNNAKPFIKWAGGKRKLVSEIRRFVPAKFNTYWEPFLGGGAVFFGIRDLIDKAVLSDVTPELMISYLAIRDYHQRVLTGLKIHEGFHRDKNYYEKVRANCNLMNLDAIAARFIYLNKTCYNGLYRVNKKGEFNVPRGNYKNPKICDNETIVAVSKALQGVRLEARTYLFSTPKAGDLIYCDPPYDQTYDYYSRQRFDREAQRTLMNYCKQWRNEGVHVIVSNSDTDFIRELYQDFEINTVSATRSINSDGKGRGPVSELLIVGKP